MHMCGNVACLCTSVYILSGIEGQKNAFGGDMSFKRERGASIIRKASIHSTGSLFFCVGFPYTHVLVYKGATSKCVID